MRLLALLYLLVGVCSMAGIPPSACAEEPATVQGEVVDPAAYLRQGRHGMEMEEETYEAVDGGQTLALLEEATDTLYLFLTEEPGEDPNELVYDYVNRPVKVTGTIYARSGLKGIVAATAEPVETAPEATGEIATPVQTPPAP